MRAPALWILVPLLACLAPLEAEESAPPLPHAEDLRALLEGVSTVATPGVPGTISVFGEEAFPVLLAPAGGRPAPVAAAARLGRGRVVVLGHNGYFGDAADRGDTGRFLANACRWAAGSARSPVRVALGDYAALGPRLTAAGFTVVPWDARDARKSLARADVLCAPVADLGEAQERALRGWLQRGGGLLCGLPGWGWQQLNPGKDLATENAGNRLFAPAGLVWGSNAIETPKGGLLRVDPAPTLLAHAAAALDALLAQSEGAAALAPQDAALAVATVTRCIRDLPPGDTLLLPRLARLVKRSAEPRFVPTAAHPLTDEGGLGKLLLTLQIEGDRDLPPEKVRAHPAAEHFPGAVPSGAPRVRRAVDVDTRVPGWHGTGLYAAPGEVVRVRVPAAAVGHGLALRIGAHKDQLWDLAAWRRAPEITRETPLEGAQTRLACAFGGLVYVVVPPDAGLGTIRVEVQGCAEAPRFVLGETSLAEWRETIRARPAPWAELETRKVVLTLPSAVVRELEDPAALMTWWDGVLDACADLAALPHERVRPERYVADEQISAGYMHAGYPIMTHLDAAPRFVDLERLSTAGDWGMFHEMGHNHQHRDWTFGGTVEVTCNLFSLYCMETVCRKGIGHEAMTPASIAKNRALHAKGGSSFELWKTKPFTALIMYYELRQAFGWDAYKQVFATYRDLPSSERPRDDEARRDQWLVRMSRTVGRDLGPFFTSWGVPTSAAARASVADLPGWMPE